MSKNNGREGLISELKRKLFEQREKIKTRLNPIEIKKNFEPL